MQRTTRIFASEMQWGRAESRTRGSARVNATGP